MKNYKIVLKTNKTDKYGSVEGNSVYHYGGRILLPADAVVPF